MSLIYKFDTISNYCCLFPWAFGFRQNNMMLTVKLMSRWLLAPVAPKWLMHKKMSRNKSDCHRNKKDALCWTDANRICLLIQTLLIYFSFDLSNYKYTRSISWKYFKTINSSFNVNEFYSLLTWLILITHISYAGYKLWVF